MCEDPWKGLIHARHLDRLASLAELSRCVQISWQMSSQTFSTSSAPVCSPHMFYEDHHCPCPQKATKKSSTHLHHEDTYVRMLFTDYSLAFNTIVPPKLVTKLRDLALKTALFDWILNFLTGRPQTVQIGSTTFSTLTLNTGAPQGCMLSPL